VLQDELNADYKRAMVERLRHIPRPAPSLQKLVSKEFMTRATTKELSEVVMCNPLQAAKVLATVNSPFYGLRTPVLSMGQAITFLGFNTVRSIGLRYMLGDSVKAGNPELTRIFDTIWSASALGSELCLKMEQKLNMSDHGVPATHMVLSFIGQLASCSLMPEHVAGVMTTLGLLERTQGEQTQLGLGSAEIGSLLMQEWGLPGSIIDDVRDIDHILVTPAPAMDNAQRGSRLALCYLCARLGERLAQGTLSELAAFDLGNEQDLNLFNLRSYLQTPALARLPEYLHSDEVLAAVQRMQESIPAPG
jgi:HD-like signal output (HDOD) protein